MSNRTMKWTMNYFLLALLLACSAAGALRAADTTDTTMFGPVYRSHREPPAKLISCGWDSPHTDELAKVAEEFDAAPVDGFRIFVRCDRGNPKPDEKFTTQMNFWSKWPWQKEWLETPRKDLLAFGRERLANSFIGITAGRNSIDYFADEEWEVLLEKLGMLAELAKETGVKGFIFDPESYRRGRYQFGYPLDSERSFAEYEAKARERGRQMMEVVGAAYPDITILSFRFLSYHVQAASLPRPEVLLKTSTYGLLPAFLNGMLDALPEEATLVDGVEGTYLTNTTAELLRQYNDLKAAVLSLVAPENRKTYLSQVQIGFAIYLDAYVNKSGRWTIDGHGEPAVERLRRNLTNAMALSEGYVWFWGEKQHFLADSYTHSGARKKRTGKSWEEALPGATRAISWARAPGAAARDWFAEKARNGGLPKNELANGGFEKGPGKPPANKGAEDWKTEGLPEGWSSWQKDDSKGTFSHNPAGGMGGGGAAKAVGVRHGCFIQEISVKPGEQYILTACARITGKTDAYLIARWKTTERDWVPSYFDKAMALTEPVEGQDGWVMTTMPLTVPQRAGRLTLLLMSSGEPDASVTYDNVGLFRLTPETLWGR